MPKSSTVLFEDKYGVNIESFSTTCEIDKFVAKENGAESLEVVLLHPDIISSRGDVFPKLDVDIDSKINKALKM